MKTPLLLLLYLFTFYYSQAQSTFNRQYALNYPFKVFTSVLPTDSCYYATGIVTDTVGGIYKIGNIFVKTDLQGEVEFIKPLITPGKFYETWLGDLTPTDDGGFIDIGTVKDSTTKGVIIKYDAAGDTLFTSEFLHPYYPDESFMYLGGIKIDSNQNILILGGIALIAFYQLDKQKGEDVPTS